MRSLQSLLRVAVVLGLVIMGATAPAIALVREPRRPVPIVLDRSQFQGPCDTGASCGFWYGDGSFAIGDANWSFLDLDQWNVRRRHTCAPPPGASTLGDYIRNGYPEQLGLRAHHVTYVCSSSGHASTNWQDFVDSLGDRRFFPVNDCDHQVSSTGAVVPCGAGAPDKYAIVGFARLRFDAVYKGTDPRAIGSPGTPPQAGSCGWDPLGLRRDGTRNLANLAHDVCGVSSSLTIAAVPYTDVVIRSHDGTVTYVKCPPSGGTGCDYLYDESTFTITWEDATTKAEPGKQVMFTWQVDGTPATSGACGVRAADPNSICLVLTVP
jgi:hypothetical protein